MVVVVVVSQGARAWRWGVCKARRDDLTAASFGASDAKMELVGHRQQDLLRTSHTSDGWGGWGEWPARRQKLAVRRRAGTRDCKEIDSRLTWAQEPELTRSGWCELGYAVP